MIYGVGTDIVSKNRIAALCEEFDGKFARRILTKNEFDIFVEKGNQAGIEYLSRRFAAKEAVSKSLGEGIGSHLSFKDIEVLNDPSGKPFVKVAGYENLRFNISISDEKDSYAIAFVVAEK